MSDETCVFGNIVDVVPEQVYVVTVAPLAPVVEAAVHATEHD
jgi:hypothetical protein